VQNEIMATHWTPQQVTIFTAVVYYKENNELKISRAVSYQMNWITTSILFLSSIS